MSEPQALQLNVVITSTDATEEELDQITRQLFSELKDFGLESLSLAVSDKAPVGAKGVDSATMGTIVMAVLPSMLPQILEFLQAWTLQSKGRVMKFKGKLAGQQIEFEGSFDEMEKLVALLDKEQKKRKK